MKFTTEADEGHKLELAAEILTSGGTIRLQALGTSMLPSIWPSDVLSIEGKPENIVPGDIVLVARDRRFFVHRLVEKDNSVWITRGDSLSQNDEPVADAQVLGRVSLIHQKGKVVVPNSRLSLSRRSFAWLLCNWNSLRNIALRFHSIRQCGIETATLCRAGSLPAVPKASCPCHEEPSHLSPVRRRYIRSQ